ncbi:MAG: hypothetical protein ACXVY8_02655 [Gaiellaceae bacterium]
MEEQSLHRVSEELGEPWIEQWVDEGLEEIEAFLAKHAAFHSFLDEHDA